MTGQLLTLPVAIPWFEIAVSPDMMDQRFCNKRFPFTWRSSLAISIHEPPIEELPEGLCGQRLSYLKVTCSITGYQPSEVKEPEADERERDANPTEVRFPDVPTEELDRILAEYFACYGVLLNVAVFPFPSTQSVLAVKDTIEFESLDFDDAVGVPNPLVIRGVAFEATGRPQNALVDLFPAGGDGTLELDLPPEMVITLPSPADRIVARVARTMPGSLTLEAFRGGDLAGEAAAGEELDVHELVVEAPGIDRVILRAPEGAASLLDLSYFDSVERPVRLSQFPHVVDVQPKVRDLYQAASETGEVLTSSASGVKTDKSFTSSEATETGFTLGAGMGPPVPTPGVPSGPGKFGSASFEHKRSEREEDTWAVATDASRERRETQGTTTQLSQMYNLLTGYHVGTNRASFLMLPRPHVLQPTDHRTFVQGLRAIEGIQEFLLIVSRPAEVEGLSIEASLDTGHFPEDVTVEEPPEEFDEGHEDFVVAAESNDDSPQAIEVGGEGGLPTAQHTIESGWVIDRRESRRGERGNPNMDGWDPGHPGIKDLDSGVVNAGAGPELDAEGTLFLVAPLLGPWDPDPVERQPVVKLYNYRPISDSTVQVSGFVLENLASDVRRKFRRNFRVFTRSPEPKPSSAGPSVKTPFLITTRNLCVRVRSADPCPQVVPPPPDIGDLTGDSAVSEDPLEIQGALLRRSVTSETRGPAVKDLLRKIQGKMVTSGRLRTRYPNGEIGFFDTDLFANRVRDVLPTNALKRPVRDVEGLPEQVASAFEGATVAEALALPLPDIARRAGISIPEAARARMRLLGGNPPGASAKS